MTTSPLLPDSTVRRTLILSRITSDGFVRLEALAAEFGVSMQTVRRDIIALADEGLVQRFHGGAVPVGHREEAVRLDHSQKSRIGRPEKLAIGRRAAALIPDGACLYLDVGTTMEACAAELAQKRRDLTIFTNSMRCALAFDPRDNEIVVLGGRLSGRDGSLLGEDIVLRLQNIHLDIALIACSAVDENDRVMDYDLSKIAVKKAAMAAADRSWLLATKTKFGRKALATIARLEAFERILSDD